MNKQQREEQEQIIADEKDAYETGAEFFRHDPEALMVEVWRQADRLYQPHPPKGRLQAFYMGFRDARLSKQQYELEQLDAAVQKSLSVGNPTQGTKIPEAD